MRWARDAWLGECVTIMIVVPRHSVQHVRDLLAVLRVGLPWARRRGFRAADDGARHRDALLTAGERSPARSSLRAGALPRGSSVLGFRHAW